MENKIEKKSLSWEVNVPLATNPFILRDLLKMFVIAFLITFILFSLIFITQGEIESILPIMRVFLIVMSIFTVLMWLIMLLFFGNRLRMRFTLSDKGAAYETLSKRAKMSNRAAIITGLLTGKFGLIGTGLIASSTEDLFIPWKGIAKVIKHPSMEAIALRNNWRVVMIVYCNKDNFNEALEYINQRSSLFSKSTEKRKSPLLRALMYTILTIVAVLPLMTMPYPFEVDLLLILLILGFAMATIWLFPVFGYVVIPLVLVTVSLIIFTGLQVNKSELFGDTYRNYELLFKEEWVFMGIAFLGMAFLIWLSLQALRGKIISMLMGDYEGQN